MAAAAGANKMVWPFLMGGAAVLAVTSLVLGNGQSLRSASLMLSGFIVARLIMNLPISGEYLDVLFSAMWVTVALSMPLGPTYDMIPSIAAKAAVLGCALCSLWGRLAKAEMYFGSPPYMTADILLGAAMLLIGWSLRHDIIDRITEYSNRSSSVVGNHNYSGSGNRSDSGGVLGCKESEALPASKVRAHG